MYLYRVPRDTPIAFAASTFDSFAGCSKVLCYPPVQEPPHSPVAAVRWYWCDNWNAQVLRCPSQARLVVHLGWEVAHEAFVQSYLCQSPTLVGTFSDTYSKEHYISQALPGSLLDVSE